MADIYRLKGQVKHYEWGGTDFIPDLLGQPNIALQPCAEYWMGIHPQGSAQLIDAASNETIELSKFEPGLPFLLKVLDVRDMLSIQVHPNKVMAAIDFERENKRGIPLDATNRNYKDANHKPELMVALSDFWLLHGFRSIQSFHEVLIHNQFLRPLEVKWKELGLPGLYRWIMEMPQAEVNRILKSPLALMTEQYQSGRLEKSDPAFWAARAVERSGTDGDIDRGIFSIFLFNLVKLERGQGIFQGAGLPHAYLEGRNVEIMANSDNVLRGGLTPKHIDVAELLRHVLAEPVEPKILNPLPDASGICHYPAPVSDFQLRSVSLSPGQTHPFQSDLSCLLLLPEGSLEIETSNGDLHNMGVGAISYYLPAATAVTLHATAPCFLFIASAGSGPTN